MRAGWKNPWHPHAWPCNILNNKVVNFKTLNDNDDERKDGDDDDNDKTEHIAPVSPAALTRWL